VLGTWLAGGAYLLGLQGLVVIAHGSSSRVAIANAIRLAARGVEHRVVARLQGRPEPLRPLIEDISYSEDYGVVMTMKGGIPIRFGPGARAEAKWAAAAAVLADPKLDALGYVDVRVPERPAAGAASIVSTTG